MRGMLVTKTAKLLILDTSLLIPFVFRSCVITTFTLCTL